MNANVQALGGKVSTGETSEEMKAERAMYDEFRLSVVKMMPVSSNEKALLYRRALVKYNPALKSVFTATNYGL